MVENSWAFPHIIQERCTLCGVCVRLCPYGVLGLGRTGVVVVLPKDCNCCGICEEVCPEGAIDCPFEIVWERDTGQLSESLSDGGRDA